MARRFDGQRFEEVVLDIEDGDHYEGCYFKDILFTPDFPGSNAEVTFHKCTFNGAVMPDGRVLGGNCNPTPPPECPECPECGQSWQERDEETDTEEPVY